MMHNSSRENNKPSKAFERPKSHKSKPIVNKNKISLLDDKLVDSSWKNFILFINNNYSKFIPHNYDKRQEQKENTSIQEQCILLLITDHYTNWKQLIYKLNLSEPEVQKIANNLCRYLSRNYTEEPALFLENWQKRMTDFVHLFELALSQNKQPDLVKLEQLVDIIDYFNRSGERTFWFLSQLPKYLDNNIEIFFNSSSAYQEILKFGASEFLGKFGYELQKEFHLTRTAIKDRAAQNLVQELGETESNLKSEIERLELKNEELKNQIEAIKTESFTNAVFQLAQSLQGEQQPVLDQLFHLYKRLDILLENNENLSPQETLTCFINLEALFKAFKSINITLFPDNINQIFEVTGQDLDEHKYNYISGSQFTNKEEKKTVKCIAPGWCVNSAIVTPAKVEEVKEFN
ncbi:nucleotide exchange factor GrpE [Geminocystis sp. GBBB08]|uniref:nucleotide exchange factor GrpE n=1 Tax=Geminocystis sp. GBBB08 TaxID=2604140 RepID=UPI0027E2A90F|nr:nucleotide exchange factor GrpE [Geminocystis sp. GBBB08]MBL1208438.1 nucleotide exchange factor GrpE [Geminocystis sp. GBBB08]